MDWYILANGVDAGAVADAARGLDIGQEAPTAHVHQLPLRLGVGAAKAICFGAALRDGADWLLELDHDDELTPDAIQRLLRLDIDGAEKACVYSDTATRSAYSPDYGWEYESVELDGRRYIVNRTPAVSARSLVDIFYAPNHLRAWSAASYAATGGHDPGLGVCDDQDLLCRTYAAGHAFRYLPAALYIQHESADQTQVKRNDEIQRTQTQVGTRHLYAMAEREARDRDLMLLDLGGAHGCPPGYTAVDVRRPSNGGPWIECDLAAALQDGELPFETDTVGVVRAHDFLEHMPRHLIIPLMNELHRILAPGGWLLTSTPSTDGRGAWQDPTHVSGWNSNSWWYYTRRQQQQYIPEFRGRFQLVRNRNHYPSAWHRQHEIVYCEAALWALKGQPQIGLNEWL